ncbi:MAG: periplasmic heavy metal sensor [Rhodobacter sp.]|nr:periplasmic heavy metal sensor [Rhodobacter sp.]
MTDTPKAPVGPVPPSGIPRWMKLLLAVSLAVNLGMLGMLGGAALRGAGDRGRPDVRDIGFGPFTDALSPQDRQELRRAFLQGGGNPRAMRQMMRTEVGALLQLLRTEPLQEVELRAAFNRLRQRGQERLDLGQRLLADHIIAMSPDDRARFADRLEAMMARGGRTNPRPAPPE